MTNTTINFLISDWDEKNKRHYSNCVETKAKQDAANALDGLFTQTLSPNPLSNADFSGIGALREEFLHRPSVDTSFRDSQNNLTKKIAALSFPSLNIDGLLTKPSPQTTNADQQTLPFALANKVFQIAADALFPPANAMTVNIPHYISVTDRPKLSEALSAYNEVHTIYDLQAVAQGRLKYNLDQKIFPNSCAICVSRALTKAGLKIPKIEGKTISELHNQYFYRLSDLDHYLTKTFGPPDCEWHDGKVSGGVLGKEACSNNDDKKGILIEQWTHVRGRSFTGHGSIVDGDIYIMKDGKLWLLPDDKKKKEISNQDDILQSNDERPRHPSVPTYQDDY